LGKKLVKKRIHDYKMYLNPADRGISQTLMLYGSREQQLKILLEREIEPGYTVIDLGANIGYYVLMEWRLTGSAGKIHALEPAPQNFELLAKNIELNAAADTVTAYPIGGGEKCGKAQFFLSNKSNLGTFVAPCNTDRAEKRQLSGEMLEVELVDMTSFIRDKGRIDLIRMDIEGFEIEVLRGLRPAIAEGQFTGKIVFECHFPEYNDEAHSLREELHFLFSHGYAPKYMTSNDETTTHFRKFGYYPEITVDTAVGVTQGIYRDVTRQHAEQLICNLGGVRDVLLEKVGKQEISN